MLNDITTDDGGMSDARTAANLTVAARVVSAHMSLARKVPYGDLPTGCTATSDSYKRLSSLNGSPPG